MANAVEIDFLLRGHVWRLDAANIARLLFWSVNGRRARLPFSRKPQGSVVHAVNRSRLPTPASAIFLSR